VGRRVAQTICTHGSTCTNDKIKGEKKIKTSERGLQK
jgi:hypothetical protein